MLNDGYRDQTAQRAISTIDATKSEAAVSTSLGSLLDRNDGLGPGFNFLRLALAVSIVAYHSVDVTRFPMWKRDVCR